MAFRGLYKQDGKTMQVLACTYEVSRKLDPHGQKASGPKGGRVTVTVQCTDDTSILSAMLNSPFQSIGEAKVEFKKPNEDAEMKTITLEDAYCVYAKEVYDADSDFPYTLKFTLSANKMTVGADTLENNWKQ